MLAGPPDQNEVYKVTYTDQLRIGWKQVSGENVYIEKRIHTGTQKQAVLPKVGET